MIYQMTIYYGATVNGQAIYTMENTFLDCTKLPKTLDDKVYKEFIMERIKKDGFNPSDFEIGFLTKEQYENRLFSNEEKTTVLNIKNQ